MKSKLTIGITDCLKYSNYEKWFLHTSTNIEIIKLSYHENNADKVEVCDGIVLSGGEDVHPKFYNSHEFLSQPDKENIDEKRDEFEWQVIEKSLALEKPVLGICRGLQLMNVFLGGTLVFDIPVALNNFQHGKIEGNDQLHSVSVANNSLLHSITGQETGQINSAHHQSVKKVADDLRVIAVSESVVEAMQWKNPQNKSWLLLIQWHPERMYDQQNPFVYNIKKAFIQRCEQ